MAVFSLEKFSLQMLETSVIREVGILKDLPVSRGVLINEAQDSYPVSFWKIREGREEKIAMTGYGKASALEFVNRAKRAAAVQHAVEYAEKKGIKILNAQDMKSLWERYVSQIKGRLFLFSRPDGIPHFEINVYLATLMFLPYFYEEYEDYTLSPDRVVTFQGDETVGAGVEEAVDVIWREYNGRVGAVPCERGAKTEDEWEYIIFCLIFAMGKSVSGAAGERGDRFNMIYRKRLEVLKQAKNDATMNVDAFLGTHVNPDDLMNLHEHLSYYPILKGTILGLVMLAPDTVATNLKMMLREHQLSVFCAIEKFMATKDLTALHLLPEVAQHYRVFWDTLVQMRTRFGINGWKYVKILDPNTQATAAARFPHLAVAARAWIVAQPDCGTFGNVVAKAAIPAHYAHKATIRVPERFIRENPMELDAIREAMLQSGMNIDPAELTDEEWRKIVNLDV
uniref:Nucleoprotein n=1 Tax=Guadeloupe mosquito mononega-like virus TaxID=2607732 RepID=A0A5C1K3D3_9MONO|nr:nucleoprotein [Guadeloupe mosquito mononega-like virus]